MPFWSISTDNYCFGFAESGMTIHLDHVIVHARNKVTAAKMLADLLGVPWAETTLGPFSAVYVNVGLTLDFIETTEPFPVEHFCFRVDQADFDAILTRLQKIRHSVSQRRSRPGRYEGWRAIRQCVLERARRTSVGNADGQLRASGEMTAPPLSHLALRTRPLVAKDQDRLWDWLHVALWDPPPAGLRPREILQAPPVRIYAEDWGRAGDVGVVGELDGESEPIGACWMRCLPAGRWLGIELTPARRSWAFHCCRRFSTKDMVQVLMMAALNAARDHGYRQVSLTVHPQNPAIRMYQRCGFEKRDVRNGYHLMVATL